MAIWQTWLHLLPIYFEDEMRIQFQSCKTFREVRWPPMPQMSFDTLRSAIDSSFLKTPSWSESTEAWGDESDVFIELCRYELGPEARVRIHAGQFLVKSIVSLANCLASTHMIGVSPELRIVIPTAEAIINEIRMSRASRFADDPRRFLLGQERMNE
jgi:hypothetical protein